MAKPLCALPLFALAALLILPLPARAGGPVLLRDIQDEPGASASSGPRRLTPFKGQVAFLAGVPNGSDGLWISDGTGPGTRTVFQDRDVERQIAHIVGVVNGFLFFSADGEVDQHGTTVRNLWRTDGTRAGTLPLAAGFPRLSDSEYEPPPPIVVTREALYFLNCAAGPCSLWRSDGTPTGTAEWKHYGGTGTPFTLAAVGGRLLALVADGNLFRLWAVDRATGAESFFAAGSPGPSPRPTTAGGKLFFFAEGVAGTELWASDGTSAGTRALTDFAADLPVDREDLMTEIAGRLYFVANDIVHGYELWRSDGTPQGTVRVSDFGYFEALEGLAPQEIAEVGGKVLFRASDGLSTVRLWMSDGRPESTASFRSLCRSEPCGLPQSASRLLRVGGKVFIAGDNGLWSTDGTLAGTRRFAEPLCASGCATSIFQALRGRLAFTARDAAHGTDLWTSDGSPAGTRRLTDVPGESGVSGPPLAVGPRTFFAAFDRHGEELWVTDTAGTRLVADIGRSAPGADVREMTPAGDRLFFTACDARDRAVWVSGGTPETTAQVPGTAGGCSTDYYTPIRLTAAGGRLFFAQRDAAQVYQIWSTDGGAPVQVTHLGPENEVVDTMTAFGDRLLAALRIDGQVALWQSNAAGNALVEAVELPEVRSIDTLWKAGGELYFRSFDDRVSLWRTDGTPAGTRRLHADLYPSSGFVRLGPAVLFAAESRDDNDFQEGGLWKTDGTAAGTVPVVRVLEEFFFDIEELTVLGDRAYFRLGSTLWRSDGTAAGTVAVRDFADGPRVSEALPFGLTVLGAKLYFAADDGVHGRELWESDGTAAGTRMVVDIQPGRASGVPVSQVFVTLAGAGGKLYFAGDDGAHGTELWESDGTAAGTRMARDLAPEAASSLPGQLTPAGGHLFFTADDALHGHEPWALPLAGPAGCVPTATRLCLNGGRYQVEAVWRTAQGVSGNGQAVALSGDTGYFWFFDAANVEAVVKVLDGRGLNGHVWVFYGALSNVEYSLTVTDTRTGFTRRYFNPLGTLASVGDTQGFGPLGAHATNPAPPVAVAPMAAGVPLPLVSERSDRAAAGPCQPTARRLCLSGGRFAVEVAWKDFQNRTGTGTAVPLTADTGYFWFFDAANVELVVKVLDGRPVNGRHWVFYGALSNVEYTLTITDTETGAVKTYRNPSGRFASAADIGAF